jgi:molybdopterin converting factor small subunit
MPGEKTDGGGRGVLPPWDFSDVDTSCCGVREMTMRVRVKLFATLSRYFGEAASGIPFEVDLPEGAALADLVNHLKLPRNEVKVLFVNGRSRSMDWALGPGDEIGIFPIVAGG